jgi:hypothetical protein
VILPPQEPGFNPVAGLSKRRAVMVDLDHTKLTTVVRVAKHAIEWFKKTEGFDLEGFAVRQSSPPAKDNPSGNHHLVFNRYSGDAEQTGRIVAYVIRNCGMKKPAEDWLVMQTRKSKYTLRISAKGAKPAPITVCRFGRQDKAIREIENDALSIRLIGMGIPVEQLPKGFIPFRTFYGGDGE